MPIPTSMARAWAIFGDPDTVAGLVSLAVEMGMNPTYALTGTPDKKFEEEVHSVSPDCEAMIGDTFLLHQKIKNIRWICSSVIPMAS